MYQLAELLLRLIIGKPRTLTHNVYHIISPRLYDILCENEFMAHLKEGGIIGNNKDLEVYLKNFGIKIIGPLVRSDETVRHNVTIMSTRILSLEDDAASTTLDNNTKCKKKRKYSEDKSTSRKFTHGLKNRD